MRRKEKNDGNTGHGKRGEGRKLRSEGETGYLETETREKEEDKDEKKLKGGDTLREKKEERKV